MSRSAEKTTAISQRRSRSKRFHNCLWVFLRIERACCAAATVMAILALATWDQSAFLGCRLNTKWRCEVPRCNGNGAGLRANFLSVNLIAKVRVCGQSGTTGRYAHAMTISRMTGLNPRVPRVMNFTIVLPTWWMKLERARSCRSSARLRVADYPRLTRDTCGGQVSGRLSL